MYDILEITNTAAMECLKAGHRDFITLRKIIENAIIEGIKLTQPSWCPIHNFPRDGSEFIALDKNGDKSFCFWQACHNGEPPEVSVFPCFTDSPYFARFMSEEEFIAEFDQWIKLPVVDVKS